VAPPRFGYDGAVTAEFIVNPRRAPRAPARCRAAVHTGDARFETETEDIGAMGCQVVSPRLVRKRHPVELIVTNEKVGEPLEANGEVAWVSAQAPWRVGIAFADASLAGCARWFERLVAAYPALAGYRRVPDRIRTDATVFLGAPPRFLVDFTSDEATLLRAIASGARLDELMARLRDGWPAAQRALFSLIARQAVTFQRGQAVHPDSWKRILSDIEASLAVESLGRAGAGVRAPPAAPPPAIRGADARGPQPDFEGAGIGWRTAARPRSPEAQAAYEGGLSELRAGNVAGALALLRRALSLAPGDAEIARQIGTVAFKGWAPRGR
jgi:hypothetical protein